MLPMSSLSPSSREAVQRLAAGLGHAIASALGRAGGGPVQVVESRGARSTWGQFRPTLSRAARAIVLNGVPGGVVVDPDQRLAARPMLAFATNRAVRDALTPRAQARPTSPAPKVQLAEELGVLVVAYELRQGVEAWRLRVCLPANTLMAVLQQVAAPDRSAPASDEVSPRTEVLRELARQDPGAVSDLIRRWLTEEA